MLWTNLEVAHYLESWESEENTKLVTQHLRDLTFSLNWGQGEVEWTWLETQFICMPHKDQGKLEVTHMTQQYRIRPQMKPLTYYKHPKNYDTISETLNAWRVGWSSCEKINYIQEFNVYTSAVPPKAWSVYTNLCQGYEHNVEYWVHNGTARLFHVQQMTSPAHKSISSKSQL